MLSTERLTLVPHAPEHFEAYAAFWAKDPGHFLRSIAPMRPEDAWTRLLKYHGHWQAFGYGPFLGFDATGALVLEAGFAIFHRGLGPRFDDNPEAMWKVDVDAQGWGIAREAMTAISAWFDTQSIATRSVCMIDPDNLVSIRVAERIGFKEYERTNYRDAPIILFERLTSTAS
jgi:RimJ/RimL family protein N-acetyltransferase